MTAHPYRLRMQIRAPDNFETEMDTIVVAKSSMLDNRISSRLVMKPVVINHIKYDHSIVSPIYTLQVLGGARLYWKHFSLGPRMIKIKKLNINRYIQT